MNQGEESGPGPKVLIVDDDRTQAEILSRVLELDGFRVSCAFDPHDALEMVRRDRPDGVVSDLKMPGMSGLDLFAEVRKLDDPPLFIIITAFGTLETAVDAMRAGVDDFITKPIDTGELTVKLDKALRVRSLESENTRLRQTVDALRERVHIVGSSRPMQEILATVEQVSRSQATVLVQGESGTGKELVARAIHVQSPRHAGPYVKVNCAAIPDSLLEDELFGHVRGAFTGAVGERKGRFELAHGGTIFLDEVGDLPLHLQPKLLRVLQEREIEPVGESAPRSVDVRVIAATHQNLGEMVGKGEFREDLFYRLNVIPISIPPLRERGRDVIDLAEHFLRIFREENHRKIAGLTRDAEERLLSYSWPGNVRELENCIERAVVLSVGERIDAADLLLSGPRREGATDQVIDALFDSTLTLDELEQEIIRSSLARCEGNLSRTARILGLTRRTLQYRVEKIRSAAREGATEEDPSP